MSHAVWLPIGTSDEQRKTFESFLAVFSCAACDVSGFCSCWLRGKTSVPAAASKETGMSGCGLRPATVEAKTLGLTILHMRAV